MRQLRNLGIASIISVYLMGCSPNTKIYKILHSKNSPDKKIENSVAEMTDQLKSVEKNANKKLDDLESKFDYINQFAHDDDLSPRLQKRITKYYSDPKFMKNLFQKNRSQPEILYVVTNGFGRIDFIPGSSYELNTCLKGNYIMTAMPSKKDNPRIVMSYFTNNGEIYQQAFFTYNHNTKGLIASMVETDYNLDGERDMMFHGDAQTGKLQLLRPAKPEVTLTSYISTSLIDTYFSSRNVIEKNK